MLGGGCVQKILVILRFGHTVERRIMSHFGSVFSDYLVTFGIASIEIPVVIEYALPLAIMSAFGVTFSAVMLWFVWSSHADSWVGSGCELTQPQRMRLSHQIRT